MALVRVTEVEFATDDSMADALDLPTSRSREAVVALIGPALADHPDVTAAAAEAAIDAVDAALSAKTLVQTTGATSGGLQERFPDSNALGWKTDTDYVDGNLGTTLPGPKTVAALQRVGFPVAADAAATEGVGFGIRASDGRNTALETAATYDETTGIVPLSLRAAIAVGIVTAHHNIKGPALATLVPAGRYVLHEQTDGYHLILGEKTNA